MKIRIFWNLLGILPFAILVPLLISFYNDYLVYKNGSIVEAVIIFLPKNNTSKTDNMKFEINGVVYDKKVYESYSNSHIVGQRIKLKYLAGYTNHFLFPEESPFLWGVLNTILFISLGIACFYYGYKKQPL